MGKYASWLYVSLFSARLGTDKQFTQILAGRVDYDGQHTRSQHAAQ